MEMDDAFHIRMNVFVEEQKVPPEEEIDEHDNTAIHFVGYLEEEPIAASRLRFTGEYGKLERICILKEHRGKHYGQQIIRAMEEKIMEKGYKKAKLHAQTHAEGFYGRLGYQTVSGEFMDAGIPHVAMIKEL
jgi:predicted GNAT family N-acyltransferase